MDLPIDCALPGPAVEVDCSPTLLAFYDGGASAEIVIIFSPRIITNPNPLLYSLSGSPGFLLLILLNSSVSATTQFICLSKAMKVPTNILFSVIVTLTLKFIHYRNLLLLDIF
jgi:hypothetical protein